MKKQSTIVYQFIIIQWIQPTATRTGKSFGKGSKTSVKKINKMQACLASKHEIQKTKWPQTMYWIAIILFTSLNHFHTLIINPTGGPKTQPTKKKEGKFQ